MPYSSIRKYLFCFTVDVECDIPHQIGSYEGIEHINKLIDLLRNMDIVGTFLVTGNVAKIYPDIIKEIRTQNHEVGCHGLDHEPLNGSSPGGLNFPKLTFTQKREIIQQATQAITTATGNPPASFRAPYLSFDLESITILKEFGYTVDSSHWRAIEEKYFGPYILGANSADSILEVPVQSGLVDLEQPRRFAKPGLSGFSLRLNGQQAVREAIKNWYQVGVEVETRRLALFSCHPWEFIPKPSWSSALSVHYWWNSDQLLDEIGSFCEFIKCEFDPQFVTLQDVHKIWTSQSS